MRICSGLFRAFEWYNCFVRDGDIYYLLLACDNCDSAETAGEIVFYTKVSLAFIQEFNPQIFPCLHQIGF